MNGLSHTDRVCWQGIICEGIICEGIILRQKWSQNHLIQNHLITEKNTNSNSIHHTCLFTTLVSSRDLLAVRACSTFHSDRPDQTSQTSPIICLTTQFGRRNVLERAFLSDQSKLDRQMLSIRSALGNYWLELLAICCLNAGLLVCHPFAPLTPLTPLTFWKLVSGFITMTPGSEQCLAYYKLTSWPFDDVLLVVCAGRLTNLLLTRSLDQIRFLSGRFEIGWEVGDLSWRFEIEVEQSWQSCLSVDSLR